MRQKLDIVCIMDRSTSMGRAIGGAVAGQNEFVKGFIGDEEFEGHVTLIAFDSGYEVVRERTTFESYESITVEDMKPRGCTALIDAIGKTIEDIETRRKCDCSEQTKVMVIITTDGEENSSRSFDSSKVKGMIELCTGRGWEFIFLGANIDAVTVGASLGIKSDTTFSYVSDTTNEFHSRSAGLVGSVKHLAKHGNLRHYNHAVNNWKK